MIKALLFVIMIALSSMASDFTPVAEIEAKGTVKDIKTKDKNLYIATDAGLVQVYDMERKKFTKELKLPDVKDFMGDMIPPKIFSVDVMDGRFILLSESGKGGYSNLWMHENNESKLLIDHTAKRAIIKARFLDKNHVLFGYLGNEAGLYDIKAKKELYRLQLSPSKFSDFALNEDKTRAVYACESGVLNLIDTKTGKILKALKGINLDNVYKVDFKKGLVSGAGQDRRGSLYDASTGKGDFLQGKFLIYATGLSPSAKRVAFAMDEKNDISIYNVATKSRIALLKGQKSTLNKIIFLDEETLVSSSDDNVVMMWKLR